MVEKLADAKPKAGCAKAAGITVAIILGLGVVGALVEPQSVDEDVGASMIADKQSSASSATIQNTDTSSSMTGPQRNALRRAESYLEMKGFSRAGLIDQLSSDAGDGFEKADATFAVDKLEADWNQQAARSAALYLEMMGFSCQGLIEQLSSDAGDQFTVDEATYGAQQAGAC